MLCKKGINCWVTTVVLIYNLEKPVPIGSVYSATPENCSNGGQTHSRYDLLVWWEILELDVSGEYKPVPVEHGPERNRGLFLLHHGVQRKIGITITHESSQHLRWVDVCELVIGRVRSREEGQTSFGDAPLTLPGVVQKKLKLRDFSKKSNKGLFNDILV